MLTKERKKKRPQRKRKRTQFRESDASDTGESQSDAVDYWDSQET